MCCGVWWKTRQAWAQVAAEALRICHFDPETGEDLRHAPHSREDCEAACYDCLMSYYNQREHRLLDRQKIRDILLEFTQAQVVTSPVEKTRGDHLQALLRQAGSDLERQWLKYLDDHKYRLPTNAQVFIEACQTRPDFLYDTEGSRPRSTSTDRTMTFPNDASVTRFKMNAWNSITA